MKTISLFALVVFFTIEISGQITDPLRFPHQDYDYSYTKSSVLALTNNNLLFFWIEDENLFMSKSTDEGLSWSDREFIVSAKILYEHDNIASALLDSNKIALVYRQNIPTGDNYSVIFSYDDGLTWTSPIVLPTGTNIITRRTTTSVNIGRHGANDVLLFYSRGLTNTGIYFIRSSDNGYTWSSETIFSNQPSVKNASFVSLDSQTFILSYEVIQSDNSDIHLVKTTDNGTTWSAPSIIAGTALDEKRPRLLMDNTNTLWLFYELYKETPFEGFYQPDIVYSKSLDNGINWTAPESLTRYVGLDFNCEVSVMNNKPFISFATGRDFHFNRENFQLYLGAAGETTDSNPPPFMYFYEHLPENPVALEPVTIRCYADDETGISGVRLVSVKNYTKIDTLEMFDDGMHGDSLANDGIYGIILDDLYRGDTRSYSFLITDTDNNTVHLEGSIVSAQLDFELKTYHFDVNKIKLPINNSGVIADVSPNFATFDDITFLFSGGFLMTGYTDDFLWANAMMSTHLVRDYQPGKAGMPANDPKNNIYVVKATDPPFGQSWQDWRIAVNLGADFYDGDGDGIYNPVDLNGNGIWDLNEDRPDILGDVTAWCVYNDGVPSNVRRFNDVDPQGVEIHQTVFASGYNLSGMIKNIIFIRYRLINTGTVISEMDSVVFGVWTDPDIGEAYLEDFAGVDTLLQSAFAYKKENDPAYGNNPPSFITSILQGPIAYIPGVTFIDVNGNGVYDPGIDTPLDTAYHHNGLFIGSTSFPGAKNMEATFFTTNYPLLGWGYSIRNRFEARHISTGLLLSGSPVDPCTWESGSVLGNVNCTDVNPLFWYSGDPVSNVGWINTQAWDQRMLLSTGPFQLKENEPIDIWVAYIVGRGTNPLNSITKAKEINQYAIDYYNTNFSVLPSDVDDDIILLTDYHLFQNYPNPFNPSTTISWQSPVSGRQTLKVFDILGREVATLVDEERPAGRYETLFDASHLASGVYFYRLTAGNYINTKKMILIK